MLEDKVIKAVDDLYVDSLSWGAGQVSGGLKRHNIIIAERVIPQIVDFLDLPYIKVVIGGKVGRSYSKETIYKVLDYYFSTPKKQRLDAYYKKFPELYNRIQNNIKCALELRRKELIKQDSISISIAKAKSQLHITRRTFLRICHELNITLTNDRVDTASFSKVRQYINDIDKRCTYQSRSRLFAAQSALTKFGTVSFMQTDVGKKQIAVTRRIRQEKKKKELEQQLNVTLLESSEAQQIVNRNNSTIVYTFKLLQLPIYKILGKNFYVEEDVHKLNEFFLQKNGLKGQVARAFENKLIKEHYNFITEKTFPDLCDKRPLRCDYYLPDYNCAIEVQGGQHFNPTTFGENITKEQMLDNFKQLQYRDKLKKEYFIKHGINYMYVIDKDDFEKFSNFIKTIKDKRGN